MQPGLYEEILPYMVANENKQLNIAFLSENLLPAE